MSTEQGFQSKLYLNFLTLSLRNPYRKPKKTYTLVCRMRLKIQQLQLDCQFSRLNI